MNPVELPNIISSLNGQLDFMKSNIMERYNRMIGQIMGLINEAKNLMMKYLSKGTEWVSQNIIEIKMQIEPIMQQINDLIKKAERWIKEQMDAATKFISEQIKSANDTVDEQINGIEKFINDQTKKIAEQETKLAVKSK